MQAYSGNRVGEAVLEASGADSAPSVDLRRFSGAIAGPDRYPVPVFTARACVALGWSSLGSKTFPMATKNTRLVAPLGVSTDSGTKSDFEVEINGRSWCPDTEATLMTSPFSVRFAVGLVLSGVNRATHHPHRPDV